MTRKEIREEVIARGAENIANEEGGEARINRWIDQVIRAIDDFKPWPYLMKTKEGAAPLKIEDLAHVEGAADVTNDRPLRYVTLPQLLRVDPDLSTNGNPEFWFTEDNETVKPYPTSTTTLKVYYRKTSAPLAEDSDEPEMPASYHDVIVDGVMVKVYKQTDNFEAAAEVKGAYDTGLGGMAHSLLHANYGRARHITRTGTFADYM